MTFGVTPTGFNRKTNEDIVSGLETSFKGKFGQDSDLSLDSPNSILIGLVANMSDGLWQVAENTYNSLNVNKAEDTDLDNAASLTGSGRKSTSASTAVVSFRGDNAIPIPTDTQVKQSSTGLILKTLTDFFITQNATNWIQITVTTVTDSATYRFYINGNSYSYVADGTATADEIVAGLKVVVESASIGLIITDGSNGLMTIEATDKNDIYDITADPKMTIGKVQSVKGVTALTVGANEIAAETIDEISTAVSGLDSVTNYFVGEAGRENESNQEFRLRRKQDISVAGFNFTDAIRAKVVNEVSGVSYCRVYENVTLTESSYGVAPKSYEAVIEGGSNSDIAEKLARLKTAGIASDGEITVEVIDDQGTPNNIKFSRPVNNYLWVKVAIGSYNTEEQFPIDGEAAIKDALLKFGQDFFNIGDVIVTQKFYTPVFDIAGIGSVMIALAATETVDGPPSYSANNINLSIRQKPNFDLSRMVVIL